MSTIIKGDLLECKAHIIVQQNNCVTRKPHGLSLMIADRWPGADVYATRDGATPNTASREAEGIPGTCVLMITGEDAPTYVACLMGQVCPGNGKNDYWCRRYNKPYNNDDPDARLVYFEKALTDLDAQLPHPVEPSKRVIAFPYGIGCSLAGGNWAQYYAKIEAFARAVYKKGWVVQIYQID